MKDQPGLIVRLRWHLEAYTGTNSPLLCEDLREAADAIEKLEKEVILTRGQFAAYRMAHPNPPAPHRPRPDNFQGEWQG